jgi:hypothetical protein
MWLVGLAFLHTAAVERLALLGKSTVFSKVKAPSLVSIRFGDVND